MYILIEILFWLFVYFILHTYILYPIILYILARNKKNNQNVYSPQDSNLPFVSIVMAAYNEDEVIEQKIQSIFNTNYPSNKFNVYIGSDNSNDATNSIVERNAKQYSNLHFTAFTSRQGKANIINTLSKKAEGEILILTDANVYFEPHTIYELSKHYKQDDIALVGGLIINTNIKKSGISFQEKTYLNFENLMKYREGLLWGTMVGAFGGIYSIRKSHYHPVPEKYFMDDFYITMHVIQDGKKAILEPLATSHEDISNLIHEEFRRKVRISMGNFQNLSSFWKLANPFTAKGFSFISHKILRWFTPFFLLACLILNILLSMQSCMYQYILAFQFTLLCLPMLDMLCKISNIHSKPLRFVTHFYSMNLALLFGFIKFLKGINSNVWQPTKRNQD